MANKYVVLSLPIEPIESRYSAQWNKWFPEAFKRNDIPYITINGVSTGHIPTPDKFLDPTGTFQWKFSQLRKCLNHMGKGMRYVVFLHDGWLPGTEMFPYMRDMAGFDIKLASFWHAGGYDSTDILSTNGGDRWARLSEQGWMGIADAIFVGTRYSMNKLPIHPPYKVDVVGCPVEVPDPHYGPWKKQNIVVWPHRLSEDKHPEVFDRLRNESCFAGVEFIRTMDNPSRTKSEYYALLSMSKVAVSTATHENFGIAMVEAASLGCWPVCPYGLAYDETMESGCLYDSYEELILLVAEGLKSPAPYEYPFKDRYKQQTVTDKVCASLKRLGEE